METSSLSSKSLTINQYLERGLGPDIINVVLFTIDGSIIYKANNDENVLS